MGLNFPIPDLVMELTEPSTKIAMEAQHGLIAQVLKDVLFSTKPTLTNVDETIDATMVVEG